MAQDGKARALVFFSSGLSAKQIEGGIPALRGRSEMNPLVELSVSEAPGALLDDPRLMPIAIFAKNAGRNFFIEATAEGMASRMLAGELAALMGNAHASTALGLGEAAWEIVFQKGGRFVFRD